MSAARRGFIRTIGTGGVILAAGALGLGRCDRMPAEAIAGWTDPGSGEPDVRRWALAHAILAPNPHNMQPWLVDLREPDSITLHVDLERLLPETDPFGRQVLIGHGTFLEILRLALAERGVAAEMRHFPDGPMPAERLDARPVARIELRPDAAKGEPLFARITSRRSNKEPYDTARPVEATHLDALRAVTLPATTALRLESDPARVAALRDLAGQAMAVEMGTPRTLRESVERTRIGADAIRRHRDGIELHGPMFWWLSALGLMTADKAMTPGTLAHQGGLDYATGYFASSMAFGMVVTPGNARDQQLDAGIAYVRLNLAATAQGLGMHPVSQLLQEYPEMAGLQRELLELVGAAPGETVQMLFRMGYAPMPGPSPRRDLAAIIMS